MQELEDYSTEELVASDNGTGVDIEDTGGNEHITQPFNPALIRISTRPLTIDLLRSRIEYQEIDLAPSFQRKAGIWKDDVQSRLIESLLIRIPLPAFYIDATNDEKWLVIDGLQRLTTLKRFLIDKDLKLRGLEYLTQFEGKTYDELPRNYQRRIVETQVTVSLIEKGTPDEVKFNVYKRINTAGQPLTSQEIRHALYQGEATVFLAQLANSHEFKQAIDNGIRDERMADRECILRYLAFTITPYDIYDNDFDKFLNQAMIAINKMSGQQRDILEQKFKRAMIAARDIFGRNAFRKRFKADGPRHLINKALFEVWSVNFNQLNDEELKVLQDRKEILEQKFIALMNAPDRKFYDAVSQGTGSPKKVRLRFRAIEQIIEETLE